MNNSSGRGGARTVQFSVAANYDSALVPELAAYPVDEVYGKFPADGFSGGRPGYLATPVSEADLRSYINLLGRYGIAFNYLLNGSCFGNREWTSSWQKRVTAFIDKLGGMGVKRLTVSTPFLLELIKRRFQRLKSGSGFTPRWTRRGARDSGKSLAQTPSRLKAFQLTGTSAGLRLSEHRSAVTCS